MLKGKAQFLDVLKNIYIYLFLTVFIYLVILNIQCNCCGTLRGPAGLSNATAGRRPADVLHRRLRVQHSGQQQPAITSLSNPGPWTAVHSWAAAPHSHTCRHSLIKRERYLGRGAAAQREGISRKEMFGAQGLNGPVASHYFHRIPTWLPGTKGATQVTGTAGTAGARGTPGLGQALHVSQNLNLTKCLVLLPPQRL